MYRVISYLLTTENVFVLAASFYAVYYGGMGIKHASMSFSISMLFIAVGCVVAFYEWLLHVQNSSRY